MTWIRRNLAAVVLIGVIAALAVLFFSGKLQWNGGAAKRATGETEGGEAAEKRVSHGKANSVHAVSPWSAEPWRLFR